MTRPDLGTRPARDGYPPARPEVMDAAMVIFGAAVAAGVRRGALLGLFDWVSADVAEAWVHTARAELERTTMQRLPEASVTLEAGGQLVIAWVVDGG